LSKKNKKCKINILRNSGRALALTMVGKPFSWVRFLGGNFINF